MFLITLLSSISHLFKKSPKLKKKDDWATMIRELCENNGKSLLSHQAKNGLQQVLNRVDPTQFPSKKAKFINFLKSSSSNRMTADSINEVWNALCLLKETAGGEETVITTREEEKNENHPNHQQHPEDTANALLLSKKSLKRKLTEEPTKSCKLSKLADHYGVEKKALEEMVESNSKYFQIEKNEKGKRIVKLVL